MVLSIQDVGISDCHVDNVESKLLPPLDHLSCYCIIFVQLVAMIHTTHVLIVQDDCRRQYHRLTCCAVHNVCQRECRFVHC